MGFLAEDFLWVGTQGEIEEELVPRAGLRLATISGGPIAGVSPRIRLRNSARLAWGLGQASKVLRAFHPNVLFMTGGYVNGPIGLAAWFHHVPSVIFLPDIEPGMAIKWLSRLAVRVACTAKASLAYFAPGKAVATGYPLRPEILRATEMGRQEALAKFSLGHGRKTLFVFGGSRGARSINRALLVGLPKLLERIQVIHISGALDWPEVESNAATLLPDQRAFYRPYKYLHEEMGAAFRAADLVLARAGASMLGECPAFALPSILVPYPYAWRYQKVNADYLERNGAAIRLDDDHLMDQMVSLVLNLLKDEARLETMSASARALHRPDSALSIAELLLELGRGTNAW